MRMPESESASEDQEDSNHIKKMASIETNGRTGEEGQQEKLEPLVKACFVCLEEEGLTLCPDCNLIYYCGQVHREIHRPHSTCFPFIVRSTDDLGR